MSGNTWNLQTPRWFVIVPILFVDNGSGTEATGLPIVLSSIIINGNGATIQRAGGTCFRLFKINSPGNLTLNNVTLGNGRTPDGGASAGGGGGAISNYYRLTVNDSTITGNRTGDGSSGGRGGGIYNNLGVTANIATSTIRGNTAGRGSASEGGYGGGLYQGSGTLTITSTTFSGNTSGSGTTSGHGGGLYNGTCTANRTNVTMSGNNTSTPSGDGGGIHNEGTLNVTSSTIANNTATWPGGGLFINGGTATLKNTIVANNTGSPNGNCAGTVVNGGNNLDSGTTCGWSSTNGSMSSTNPLLGSLANNGGSVQTLALQTGSPAIDGVTYNKPNNSPATDARGGARHDIGAHEFYQLTYYFLPLICKDAN